MIEEGRTLSYHRLSEMVDAIASTLPSGVGSVGIVMGHRAEMIASILAVLKVGARYVPAEPDFPTGRVRFMMEESEVSLILTERTMADRLDGFELAYADCALCRPADTSDRYPRSPEDPSYVLYTSGTTGRPKGVCVRNRNVVHYADAFAAEFHPGVGDVMLQLSVCSFDIFVEEVFGSLLNGAAVAIPPADVRSDVPKLMRFAEKHGVTIISGFPYLMADLNRLPSIPRSIRLLISGGDVLRLSYVDRLLPQVTVYNTYGPSETTVCATYQRCTAQNALPDGTFPIGRPVKGAEVRLLDVDGNEVADGDVGEICILGGGVSMGYIGDREEENKAFVTLPDGSVMYMSGDLGRRLPGGSLAFLRRKDDQVMIRGKRVEVAEVESRLYACRGVRQALVRAYRDEHDMSYMVAYVVPSGDGLRVSELRSELSEFLAPFMIPEFFVEMKSIPLNANGKPDSKALPVVLKEGRV